MAILLFIVGLILFIGLVVVHEFGHFIVARRNGVEVEEFGIFFPPRLFSKKTKDGWVFSINALPLGGFVKLKGEHDADTAHGSFGAATLWVKSKIMAAGVVMNLLVALILLTILAWAGIPKVLPNQFTVKSDTHIVKQSQTLVEVASTLADSPAAKAGLKSGDQVLALGPPQHLLPVSSAIDLQAKTKKFAGQTVTVKYKRNGTVKLVAINLNSNAVAEGSRHTKPKGYLGISIGEGVGAFAVQRSTWSAPVVAVGLSAQAVALTYQGIGHALGGLGSIIAGTVTHNHTARQNGQTQTDQVGGPIALVYVIKAGSDLGLSFIIFIIALLSLTLAIINILPIPPMDGGRLWPTLVAHAVKKPFTAETEELINLVGFLFIACLFILISYSDVQHFVLHHF